MNQCNGNRTIYVLFFVTVILCATKQFRLAAMKKWYRLHTLFSRCADMKILEGPCDSCVYTTCLVGDSYISSFATFYWERANYRLYLIILCRDIRILVAIRDDELEVPVNNNFLALGKCYRS